MLLPNYSQSFIDAIIQFDRLAKKTSLDYAIIGGVGVSVWSKPRATQDVDMVVLLDTTQLTSLTNQAEKHGFVTDLKETQHLIKNDMFRLRYKIDTNNLIKFDLILATYPYYQSLLHRKKHFLFGKVNLPFAQPEDLIILKLISNRHQDSIDVINIFSQHGNKLDYKYIEKWAKEFDVTDKLKKLKA
jgi:hypothetical protein